MPDRTGIEKIAYSGVITAIISGLYLTSLHSYLLFHSLIEISTIAIGFTIFILAWNARRFLEKSFLNILGIGYGLISLLDLLHALAYKGMGVFPEFGANLPTQLWIAARALQALTLCVAPLSVAKKLSHRGIFGGFVAAVSLLVAMIYSGNFPACYIDGQGLTPFKIRSEYVITAFLLGSLYLHHQNRKHFNDKVFFLVVASIVCTILSELTFTAYVSVYGFANMLGHYCKLTAFYLIYRAILVTGLKEPFDLIFRDLKQAENGLTREREFSRCLLDSMADGVVACDADGKLSLFNRAAREWHGIDPMRLPPEEWASHYNLFRADGVTPLPTEEIPLARAFNGEVVRDAGMAIVSAGQAPRDILANGNLITDAAGSKLGAVVVMRDITVLRKMELELRRTNQDLERRVAERTAELAKTAGNLKEAQRIAQIGSWELDIPSNTLTWSEEIYRIFEIDPQRFGATYEAFLEAIHPDDREAVNAAYSDAIRTRTPYSIDHRLLLAGGRIKYVHEQCETSYENDQPIRSTGTVQDITGRKLAEQALTLREREYHTLLDNIPDLIVRYDTELKRTYVNPAWEKASGLSRDEVINVSAPDIPRVPQPVVLEYEQKLHRVLQSGTPETCGFLWKNAIGTELYLEYVIVPEHDRSGVIVGALAIGRDFSERRRAEEEMRRLNRELRAISNCNQALMKAEDEQTLLLDICRIICDEAGYRLAWVGYAEHDPEKNIRPVAWAGFDSDYIAEARLSWSEDLERGRGPAGIAIRSGKAVHVEDFAIDSRMAPWREAALARGYRSGIALPLNDENGRVFGVLLIYSTEPYAVTAEEFKLLEELAGDLAFGIIVLRTRTEFKRTAMVADARLRMLETAYTANLALEEVLRRMLDEIETMTGSSIAFYHFLEEDQQTLSLQDWSTNTLAAMCTAEGKGRHYPIANAGVWTDCVRARRPIIHNDYVSLTHRKGLPDGHAAIVRELVVPILRADRIVAIIGVGNKPENYNEIDVQIASLLGDFSWEIVVRKQAEEALLALNNDLEQRVKDRTNELEQRNMELERMNQLFVGRELRMIELKEKIRELERKTNNGVRPMEEE